MRPHLFAFALLTCTAALQPAWSADLASAVCPGPQPAASMTPSLTSNFYQNGLDQHQWRPFNGQHGTVATELEAYVPGEVRLVPGTALRLQTDKQTTLGHPYASGEVTTQGLFAQTYGHFEMMAKMPEANGIWPAFWLLPENNTWPPEVDILEYIYAPWGQHPAANAKASNSWMTSTAETTLHSGANNSAMAPGINSSIAPFPVYQDWNTKAPPAGWGAAYAGYHIYSIDWRPNSLVFLIDNAPVFCVSDAASAAVKRVPSMPMFMLLNDAVTSGTQQNPGWPGYVEASQQFPVAMDIAYVHVSQFNDLAPQAASAALPLDITGVTMMNGTGAITATAGATLGLRMTVTAGASIGPVVPIAVGLKSTDMTQYYGLSAATLGQASFNLPAMTAHQSYTFNYNYKIPANLAPGVYSLAMTGSYANGPVNGAGGGRYTYNNQTALITITAPTQTAAAK